MWSLGATLCHALTGKPPYEVGDNVMGALYRIVNDEPPRPANAGWLAPLLVEPRWSRTRPQRWSAAQARDFLEAGPVDTDVRPTRRTRRRRTATLETVPAPGRPAPVHVAAPARRRTPRGAAPWRRSSSRVAGPDRRRVRHRAAERRRPDPSAADPATTPSSLDASTPRSTAHRGRPWRRSSTTTSTSSSSDPEAAFEHADPGVPGGERRARGLPRLLGRPSTSTKLESISADPETMVVDYTLHATRPRRGAKTESR